MNPETIKMLKKIGIFFALFVGAGSLLGWLGYHHEWFAFVGCLIFIGFAVPTYIKLAKKVFELE
mgnify:CR=1 FL=1